MPPLIKTLIFCVFLSMGTILGLFIALTLTMGKVFSFDSEEDLYKLRRYAYMATLAISELDIYYQKNGEYPLSLNQTDLSPDYISNVFSYRDVAGKCFYFQYRVADDLQRFEIYMKTTMESTLWYWGDTGKWTYSIESTEIEFQL
ncbi:MAG: hypothetical protein ACSHX8_00590 [Opitutaceae bacterium]